MDERFCDCFPEEDDDPGPCAHSNFCSEKCFALGPITAEEAAALDAAESELFDYLGFQEEV